MRNRKVIFILADAFRYDYISKLDMKFLKEKIKRKKECFYVEKIIPSTGFCEIIEYVTGKETLDHGMFTQITAKMDWYSIRSSTKLLQLVDKIHCQNPFRKIPKIRGIYRILFDSVINKILLKKNISPEMINVRYNIPLHLLPFLEPTESKYEYDSFDFGGRDNLFVWMREKNISYDIDDFVKHNKVKGTDEDRLNRLKEKIRKRRLKDFTLLYIGYGELAHFYGTESEFFKKKMRKFSEELEEIFVLLKRNYDDFVLTILGDHGMIDVQYYINVINIFKKVLDNLELNLTLFKDYIYFVDSTLFRVWVKNKNMIKPIEELLLNYLREAIELDDEVLSYLGKFKPKFGDIILLLKPGYMFFPDFFNTIPNKGMHGYLNTYPEQWGTLISFGPEVRNISFIEKMKLSEVKTYIQSLWE